MKSQEHKYPESKKRYYPITSYGIVLFNMDEKCKYIKQFQEINKDNLIKNEMNGFISVLSELKNVNFIRNKEKYEEIKAELQKNLYFLLIKRKHSVEYVNFIRGKYVLKENSKNTPINLVKYMTKTEIQKINEKSFDELWNDLWCIKKMDYKEDIDYKMAKNKFETYTTTPNLKLQENMTEYEENEWGFPKGRINKKESYKQCATREFEEETGIKQQQIILYDNIQMLIELFYGTNGKKYKHSYFLASSDQKIQLDNNADKYTNMEIGDIQWFNANDALTKIRAYHVKKKNIIENIIEYYTLKIHELYSATSHELYQATICDIHE